jgi:hypothetical protein
MELTEFKNQNLISSEIELKDGRVLLTTKNGFKFWEADKKGRVNEIDEQRYNRAKIHRITKATKNRK